MSQSDPASNPSSAALTLSIEQTQRIEIAADGSTRRGYETYIKEYDGMIRSGLMARMSNAAFKVLHALGLRARVLGDPRRAGADAEFAFLKQLRVVTESERGQLFCFVSEKQIGVDTGIASRNTIQAATQQLVELQLIQRIVFGEEQLRLSNGRFGASLYFINPSSCLGKFEDDRAQKLSTDNADRAQKLSTVYQKSSTAQGSTVLKNCATVLKNCTLKNKEEEEEKEKEENALFIISAFFADAIGAERYDPTAKETRRIATLLAEGFTVEEIQTGITRALEQSIARSGEPPRTLTYCLPVIQRQHAESSNPPQPTAEPPAVPSKPEPTAVAESLKPNGEPKDVAPTLDDLAQGDAELRDLLELIQERNPGRGLQKSDVRAWLAVGEKHRALAVARAVTPAGLLKQAVLHGIGAQSDRAGYFAATLADAILAEWANPPAKTPTTRRNGKNGNGASVAQPAPTATGNPAPKYPADNWRGGGGR